MTTRRPLRPGFTLLEVLVVLTIIFILITLLLPAVQASREAARRIHCVNNLMQLGLAVQNYANTHDVLPPGVVDAGGGPIKNLPQGYHFGWVVQILPNLEQRALQDMFDFTTGVYGPANRTPRNAKISILTCPSDTGPRQGPGGVAEANYAGCHHDVEAPIAADNHGVFFLNSAVRYEDIPDGSSNTIFLGEKRRNGRDLGWASGTRATLRNTGNRINAPDRLYGPSPIPLWEDDGSVGQGPSILPNPKDPNLVGGFSSFHNAGANFAFGDGSVQFLRETINPVVFRCLGNRADGEMIDSDRY